MPVMLELQCGGCDATARVGPLRRELTQLSRQVARWHRSDPEALTPEGWIMFDPYTGCTYCPTCWASIENAPLDSAGVVS